MDPKDPVEHLVALKVMRLTRPSLMSPLVVTCDAKDLPGNFLNNYLKNDAMAVNKMETIAAGQFLLLPQSFGSIYLGETFSCYICVHNETQQSVNNVSVTADLQTTNHRIPLPTRHNHALAITLNPDETLNDVIHYEVKETGFHILVCEVSYMSLSNTLMSFRKFFKFQVLKPLDVKTKFYNAATDDVFVEAQVQNITNGPICLEKVLLESSPLFTVTSLNELPDGRSVFGSVTFLQPEESCQYLYSLSPIATVASDPRQLCAATNIGKLDIVWRSNLGERGRLQTSQLQRKAPDYGDLRLVFEELPCVVNLDEPFDFKCKIVNACERSLDLILKLRTLETAGLLWSGISERTIGSLEPGSSISISLSAYPVMMGLQNIVGISLIDSLLKRTYDYDDLASVFVTCQN